MQLTIYQKLKLNKIGTLHHQYGFKGAGPSFDPLGATISINAIAVG